MSAQLDAIPDFIQIKSLDDLRKERNVYQSKIESLWKEIANDFEWTAEHPELSLKTIALLDLNKQLKSDTLQTLKIIAAKHLHQELSDELVKAVIMDAVNEDNWGFILKLVEAGISPNLIISEGNTLLHLAIRHSKEIVVSELLANKANPNIPNDELFSPLHLAAQAGLKAACTDLIEYKADVNAIDYNEKTPLHHATEWDHEEVARELISKGADVDQRDSLGTPAVYQVIVGGSDEFAIELLGKMYSLDAIDALKQTCLHMACYHLRTPIALFLIDQGVQLNLCDGFGSTPLHYACEKSLVDVVDKLLERNALPDIENHQHSYPFHTALMKKNTLILECFAKHLAPLDWEKYQVYQWLLAENYDEARAIINTWKESEKKKEILAEVINDEIISAYLIESQPEWVASFISSADLETMNHETKLNLVALLPPEEIYLTLEEWDPYDQQDWLETEIELEETGDEEYLTETVQIGLMTINAEWIEHIQWGEDDPSSYSTQLICDTEEVLERLPPLAFAAAACSPMLRPILIKCITIIPPDKLAILIPVLNDVEFVHLAENQNHDEQCNLLRVATEEQKIAFLENVTLEHSQIVRDWLINDHIDLYRQLEMVIDRKMLIGVDYREQAQKLVEDLEKASARLPAAILHNTIKWKRMLKALKTHGGSDRLTHLIEQLVEKKITQSENVSVQIERLRTSVYEESSLGLSPPEEEEIPDEFLCGIYQTVMKEPVTAHGHTFEKEAISTWLANHDNCPLCRAPITMDDFKENEELKQRIEESGIGT